MEDLNGVSKKWPSGVKNKQILTVTREKVAKFLNVSNKSHHLIETLRMLGYVKNNLSQVQMEIHAIVESILFSF